METVSSSVPCHSRQVLLNKNPGCEISAMAACVVLVHGKEHEQVSSLQFMSTTSLSFIGEDFAVTNGAALTHRAVLRHVALGFIMEPSPLS